MIKKKFKVIDGVRYHSDRPDRCRDCKFWKNRVVGCTLGNRGEAEDLFPVYGL